MNGYTYAALDETHLPIKRESYRMTNDKQRFIKFLSSMGIPYIDAGDYLIIEDKGRVDINFNDNGDLLSIESYQD